LLCNTDFGFHFKKDLLGVDFLKRDVSLLDYFLATDDVDGNNLVDK